MIFQTALLAVVGSARAQDSPLTEIRLGGVSMARCYFAVAGALVLSVIASTPAKAWMWCFAAKGNDVYGSEVYNYPPVYNGASAAQSFSQYLNNMIGNDGTLSFPTCYFNEDQGSAVANARQIIAAYRDNHYQYHFTGSRQ